MMWKARNNFNHNFVCLIATIFLIFGYGKLIFAQNSPSHRLSAIGPRLTLPTPTGVTILFVNDLQYGLFPVHQDTGTICTYEEDIYYEDRCIEGLALLKTYMDRRRAFNRKAIWLSTGNILSEDLFKTLKFGTAQRLMNFLNFNASAIETNVFKHGGDSGLNYITDLNSAVVSNIDPAPAKKSVTFKVDSCYVSIIGFIDDSQLGQKVNGVTVKNYTESILEEINRIKNEQNTSNLVTVVIGATSVTNARALANIDGIDIVLFSGVDWSTEAPDYKYYYWENIYTKLNSTGAALGSARVINGEVVDHFLVGEISLPFDYGCNIYQHDVAVFKFSGYLSPDRSASQFVKAELKRLNSLNETLTWNNKDLTGEKDLCSHKECSLGNLITDAMVAALQSNDTRNSNTTIALFPAEYLGPNKTIKQGSLTVMDVYELIDEDIYINTVLLNSHQLIALLEISVNCSVHSNCSDFFHLSGLLHVEYREAKMENNSRIVAIKTVNSNSMLMNPIDLEHKNVLYNVSIPSRFLSAYNKTLEGVKSYRHSVTVIEAVTNFINNTRYLLLPAIGSRYVQLEPIAPIPVTAVPPSSTPSDGVNCYVCDSETNPGCIDPINKTGLPIINCSFNTLLDIDPLQQVVNITKLVGRDIKDLKSACLKMVISDTSGKKTVLRNCTLADVIGPCAMDSPSLSRVPGVVTFCQVCDGNLCNSSNQHTLNILLYLLCLCFVFSKWIL